MATDRERPKSTFTEIRWQRQDGSVVACTEKIKVLRENLEELRQIAQDAFEDALLMECAEEQIRSVFRELIDALDNPYRQDPSD